MKAVLDIGKTNVKLQLVNSGDKIHESFSRKNIPLQDGPYPHADVAGIWQWLLATLSKVSADNAQEQITDIIITTHGATAALVDTAVTDGSDGLVLPILDYEYVNINQCDTPYNAVRPVFSETLSPSLPAGLNLGRQIFWLQQSFPEAFNRATQLLMYPQYWGWRLTGNLAGEVTSLGCHTDMWAPEHNRWSSLVDKCQWQALMPPMKFAGDVLGNITAELAQQTGLAANCKVYTGLHDSNASYLRYLQNNQTEKGEFTVVSTGTWTILMQSGGELAGLNSERDMLANCDIYSNPVACARFMGGREYAVICEKLGGDAATPVTGEHIQAALDNLWMATPDFSEGNGPFGGRTPQLLTPLPASSAGAIATLYCALMIDQRLDDLQAKGPVYIEGAFLKNLLLCQLVAQLRGQQPVYLSADDTGTVQGALLLTGQQQKVEFSLSLEVCEPGRFTGLAAYQQHWRSLL